MLSGQSNLLRGGKKFYSLKVLSLASDSAEYFQDRTISLGINFCSSKVFSLSSDPVKCCQDRVISLGVVLNFVSQNYCHLPLSPGNAFRTTISLGVVLNFVLQTCCHLPVRLENAIRTEQSP